MLSPLRYEPGSQRAKAPKISKDLAYKPIPPQHGKSRLAMLFTVHVVSRPSQSSLDPKGFCILAVVAVPWNGILFV